MSDKTLSFCRGHSWRVRLAKRETLTPPGQLVSPLVCRGPWMSTMVLYCWCHSDSASVLLYFTSFVFYTFVHWTFKTKFLNVACIFARCCKALIVEQNINEDTLLRLCSFLSRFWYFVYMIFVSKSILHLNQIIFTCMQNANIVVCSSFNLFLEEGFRRLQTSIAFIVFTKAVGICQEVWSCPMY